MIRLTLSLTRCSDGLSLPLKADLILNCEENCSWHQKKSQSKYGSFTSQQCLWLKYQPLKSEPDNLEECSARFHNERLPIYANKLKNILEIVANPLAFIGLTIPQQSSGTTTR